MLYPHTVVQPGAIVEVADVCSGKLPSGARRMRALTSQNSSPYDGFISYRHSPRQIAIVRGLQKALHRFAKPFWQLRALRLYRDETNLSARPDLWGTIVGALDKSRYLLLIASPEAAASKWVEREVKHWLAKRGPTNLILILTDGVLVWSDKAGRYDAERTTALPPAALAGIDVEPLHVDLRWVENPDMEVSITNPMFLDSVATIAATLHGREKDAISGEDLRHHRLTRRLSVAAAGSILALAVGLSVLSYNLLVERARLQRALLESAAQESALLTRAGDVQAGWGVLKSGLQQVSAGRRSRAIPPAYQRATLEALVENRLGPKLVLDDLSESSIATLGEVESGFVGSPANAIPVAFDPDGGRIAIAMGQDLGVWSTESGDELQRFRVDHRILALYFQGMGDEIIATGDALTGRIAESPDPPISGEPPAQPPEAAIEERAQPRATFVDLTQRTTRGFDVQFCKGVIPCITQGPPDKVRLVTPDSTQPLRDLLASGALTHSGAMIAAPLQNLWDTEVSQAVLGRYYVLSKYDEDAYASRIFVFDIETQRLSKALEEINDAYSYFSVASDAPLVAFGKHDSEALGLYRISNGPKGLVLKREKSLRARNSAGTRHLTLNRDGSLLLYANNRWGTGGGNGDPRTSLVDVASGDERWWSTSRDTMPVVAANFRYFAQSDVQGNAVSDTASGQLRFTVPGEPLAFDSSGRRLALWIKDEGGASATDGQVGSTPPAVRVRLVDVSPTRRFASDSRYPRSARGYCGPNAPFGTMADRAPDRLWNRIDWHRLGPLSQAGVEPPVDSAEPRVFSLTWRQGGYQMIDGQMERGGDVLLDDQEATLARYSSLGLPKRDIEVREYSSPDGRLLAAVVDWPDYDGETPPEDGGKSSGLRWFLFPSAGDTPEPVLQGVGDPSVIRSDNPGLISFFDQGKFVATPGDMCSLRVFDIEKREPVGDLALAFLYLERTERIAEDLIAVVSSDWYRYDLSFQVFDFPALNPGPWLTLSHREQGEMSDELADTKGEATETVSHELPEDWAQGESLVPLVAADLDVLCHGRILRVTDYDGASTFLAIPPWGKRLRDILDSDSGQDPWRPLSGLDCR